MMDIFGNAQERYGFQEVMSTRPPCDTSKLSTRDISIEGGVRQRWMVRQRPSVLEGDLRSIRTCQGRIQCRERGELE